MKTRMILESSYFGSPRRKQTINIREYVHPGLLPGIPLNNNVLYGVYMGIRMIKVKMQ